MATSTFKARHKAVEILEKNPGGVRYSDLLVRIKESYPEIPKNTIVGAIWNINETRPDEVYKVSRGLYRHKKYENMSIDGESTISKQIKEEDFYEPFADYLANDLEECTKAIPLGGSRFRDKWGTPDVIGINRSKRTDIIKHEDEIVTAEIKIDSSGLITAFGQACAYQSFSHKTYIVIPKNAGEDDKSRIESLCLIFGIGLIFFNTMNIDNPQFEIRVRPQKHEPDMFYVNKYLPILEAELFN